MQRFNASEHPLAIITSAVVKGASAVEYFCATARRVASYPTLGGYPFALYDFKCAATASTHSPCNLKFPKIVGSPIPSEINVFDALGVT